MVLGDTRYTDRKHAGSALIRTIMESAWEQKEAIVGEIGGFEFTLQVLRNRRGAIEHAKVNLHRSHQRAAIDMPDEMNALGVIARLENALERFEIDRTRAEEDLHNAERRIGQYESRVGAPFELQGELDAKLAELDAINKALAASESDAKSGAADGTGGAGEAPPEFPVQFRRHGWIDDDDLTDDVGTGSLPSDPDDEVERPTIH